MQPPNVELICNVHLHDLTQGDGSHLDPPVSSSPKKKWKKRGALQSYNDY